METEPQSRQRPTWLCVNSTHKLGCLEGRGVEPWGVNGTFFGNGRIISTCLADTKPCSPELERWLSTWQWQEGCWGAVCLRPGRGGNGDFQAFRSTLATYTLQQERERFSLSIVGMGRNVYTLHKDVYLDITQSHLRVRHVDNFYLLSCSFQCCLNS